MYEQEREHYAEYGPQPPVTDPRWWQPVARNLLTAALLVGLALLLGAVVLVRVNQLHATKMKLPEPDPGVAADPD